MPDDVIRRDGRELEIVWEPLPGRDGRPSSQQLALTSPADVTLYTGARGPGKALPVETPVPTPGGFVPHGLLRPGDFVFGADGRPTRVEGVFAVEKRPTFLLTMNDGAQIVASDEHLWTCSISQGQQKSWRVMTTKELASRAAKGFATWLPARPILHYPARDLGVDPYILGAWIGDGSMSTRVRQPTGNRTKARFGHSIEFGSADAELVAAFERADFKVRRQAGGFTWLSGKKHHRDALAALGLWGTKSDTKFIPDAVLTADAHARLAVLQGLCDTDGTPNKTCGATVTTCSPRLAEGIMALARSLGLFASVCRYTPKTHHRQKLPSHHIRISGELPLFRVERKAKRLKLWERTGWRFPKIVSVEDAGECFVSCIKVAAENSLYIAGDGLFVTHNTEAQLFRFRRNVGMGYGAFWRGVIFDREYKNLDDLINKSKRWFYRFDDGGKFLESNNSLKWVWPTGEELLFRQVKDVSDYWNYHGMEFPFIGWNELTKFPTRELYDMLMSTNRSSYLVEKDGWIGGTRVKGSPVPVGPNGELPRPIPLEIFATTNPWGPGHIWVKQEFIDPAPYGKLVRIDSDVFNPKTQQRETITRTQVAIFGSYKENIYLDPKYIAQLESIKDPNMRAAWLEGSWDIVAGGALDDVWRRDVHVIQPFDIPRSWYMDRALDWGSTHPFYVGWFAEANGEEVTLEDGSKFCPARGSLILFAELYGAEKIGTNAGVRWSPKRIAQEIKAIEEHLRNNGRIAGRVWEGPADNQIRDVRVSDEDTIEKKFSDEGVYWEASDKSPGSRRNGLQLLRDRLEAATTGEGPAIYFMSHCRAAIMTLPALPRDEVKLDDVDTSAEDHPYDAVRYRVLKGNNRVVMSIRATW